MAGFAIHLRLIHQHSDYIFNVSATSIGQQESQILDRMITIDQLECLANNASKVIRLSIIMKSNPYYCRSMFGIRKRNRCS